MDAVREDVIKLVDKELESANSKFPPFHSAHEGYAVMQEEVEEAQDEIDWCKIKLECAWIIIKNDEDASLQEVEFLKEFAIQGAIELIQVAAMAQKFIDSLGGKDER